MKRGTIDHPKTRLLAQELGIPVWGAVGLLECLWQWTARYAPQGDIGKWPDDVWTKGGHWTDTPLKLISALKKCGFIDESDQHRFLVHDWEDHADNTVRKWLKRNGLKFYKTKKCLDNVRIMSGQCPDKVRNAEPLPLPLPLSDNPYSEIQETEFQDTQIDIPEDELPAIKEKTKRPKAKPKATQPDKETKERKPAREDSGGACIAQWIDLHRSRRLPDPVLLGKDTNAAMQIAKHFPDPAKRLKMLKAFLDDDARFLVEQGHALCLLLGRVNKYQNAKSLNPMAGMTKEQQVAHVRDLLGTDENGIPL